MKQWLLVVTLLLASAAANAQNKAECERLLATPVGEQSNEEIVKVCRNFIFCGLDSLDLLNCVKVSVMGMLIYDAKAEDPKFTYGTLLEKVQDYTSQPAYQAFRARQKKMLIIINEIVSNENWKEARGYLIENGFTDIQTSEIKELYDHNQFESWTYGDLLSQYANSQRRD